MSLPKFFPVDCSPAIVAELNRFVVALPHWRWLPGMLSTDGARCVEVTDDGPKFWTSHATYIHAQSIPDFADPATRGCLLELVRDVWNAPHLYPQMTMRGYQSLGEAGAVCYSSEIEALVGALAAKKPTVVP